MFPSRRDVKHGMGGSNRAFLIELAGAVSDIERRATKLACSLDRAELNWRPNETAWSAGQCFQHLVQSNAPYFPIFYAVSTGAKRTTLWERFPLLPRIWGALLLNTVRPETTRKTKAPRIFQPETGDVPVSVVDEFTAQQRRLCDAMESLRDVNLDKTIVTSPVATFITYSLRDALAILVAHEERHLRQAKRVIAAMQSDESKPSASRR